MKNAKYLFLVVAVALAAYMTFQITYCKSQPTRELTRQGHTMTEWLKILTTDKNSADNPLRIVQVTKDSESGYIGMEIPISFDLLLSHGLIETNGIGKGGKFDLVVNGRAQSSLCERAANGNSILGCNINDFAPGTNQVQVEFFVFNLAGAASAISKTGPPAQFVSPNAVYIRPKIFIGGVNKIVLWADLSVSNANYSLELLDTNGNRIKTLAGHTLNGTINEQWDLTGDSGRVYPRDAFGVIYHVAISNSSGVVTQDYKISAP